MDGGSALIDVVRSAGREDIRNFGVIRGIRLIGIGLGGSRLVIGIRFIKVGSGEEAVTIGVRVKGKERKKGKVLESYDTIFLLGRDFLSKFEWVTFDWNGNRVRLGKHCVPVNSTLSGATSLVRAQTVQYMEETESTQYMDSCNVNPQLPSTDQAAIRNLLDEFSHVFAQNPKRPGRTKVKGCEHAIITGDAHPVKNRPRRVPHQWQKDIQVQVGEMLGNGIITY